MAENITLSSVSSPLNSTTALNAVNNNFSSIQSTFTDVLSRSGVAPNQMNANIDMNSNRIINLPPPIALSDAARLQDVTGTATLQPLPAGGTTGQVLAKNSASNYDVSWSTVNSPIPNNTIQGNVSGGSASPSSLTATQVQALLGGWYNVRQAKTTTYTVVTGDNGTTIGLGGSAFYTVSINSASGYASDFIVVVINEDSSRAKTIAINGLPSFTLWPLQTAIVYNDNNVWQVIVPPRWVLPSSTTFYVATTGSDSNDGLTAGAPFLTINKALLTIQQYVDINYQTCTIQVADGTYTSGADLTNGIPFLNGIPTLQGNVTTPTNCIIAPTSPTTACIHLVFETQLRVQGFCLAGSSNVSYGIYCSGGARLFISGNMNFGNISATPAANYPAGVHIAANSSGAVFVNASYTISGSAGAHFFSAHHGVLEVGTAITITMSGTPAFSTGFAVVDWCGDIVCASITFSGSTTGPRFSTSHGSTIDTGNSGAAYLPGNSAGVTNDVAGNRGNYF